jgi:flagellin FlaB
MQRQKEENKMNWKKPLTKLAKQKRGIIGLEAAIILIAFVIIAATFSFMVVNQGLFATERGKTAIQEGLHQASTPLCVDGTLFVKTSTDGTNITNVVIPLRAYGVKYVAMWENETVVTLKVGDDAWANIYHGVNTTDPTDADLDTLAAGVTEGQAQLFIENTDGDESLQSFEKGYLILSFSPEQAALVREAIIVEIRLEKTAPLTIEFTVPEAMPKDSWGPV